MDKNIKEKIINEALGEFVNIVAWRRDLHRYPELSFVEERTSQYIAEVLTKNGIEYQKVAGTGILAKVSGEMVVGGGNGTVNEN